MSDQEQFVVLVPMTIRDLVRISQLLKQGYRLVHDDEQEQTQEQTKAQTA